MATRCGTVENFEGYRCVLGDGHSGKHMFANDLKCPAPPTRTEEPSRLDSTQMEILKALVPMGGERLAFLEAERENQRLYVDEVEELLEKANGERDRLREQIETMKMNLRRYRNSIPLSAFAPSTKKALDNALTTLIAEADELFPPERP